MPDTDRTCATCGTTVPNGAAFCPSCGATTPRDINEEFGENFDARLKAALADRYTVQDEIGRGGMAVVFRAHDLKHDRSVALKVLRPELAMSVGATRFEREIKVAAQLNHPHILSVFDSGEADSFLYYVMPFVDGESLRQKMQREGPLQIEEAIRFTREVAGALSYAHSAGLVHRDIKPENVLLHHNEAMIADFGIATAVSSAQERLTETGLAVGTPLYMSPEQAGSEPSIDGRSDVYSAGASCTRC